MTVDTRRLYVEFEVERTADQIFRSLAPGEVIVGVWGGGPASWPARFFELFAPRHVSTQEVTRALLEHFPDVQDVSECCGRLDVTVDAHAVSRARSALHAKACLIDPIVEVRNGRARLSLLAPSAFDAPKIREALHPLAVHAIEVEDAATGSESADVPKGRPRDIYAEVRDVVVPALRSGGPLFAPVATLGIDPELIAEFLAEGVRQGRRRDPAAWLPGDWFDARGLLPVEFKGWTTALFTELSRAGSDLSRSVAALQVRPSALAAVLGHLTAGLGLSLLTKATEKPERRTGRKNNDAVEGAAPLAKAAAVEDQEPGDSWPSP